MPNEHRSDLNSRMKAYRQSAGARLAVGCAKRFGNWFVYTAAAGSALALSSNASASIVYGTLNETASFATLGGAVGSVHASRTFEIDAAKFRIGGFSTRGRLGNPALTNAHLVASSPAGLELDGGIKRLASGNQVFAGKITFAAPGSNIGGPLTPPRGTWSKSQMGFAGIGIEKNGNDYLGWLRLEYSDANGVYKIEAFDYAYNTVAGASIAAGNTGVPEPSTAALTLLAAGAAGIAALRRRRAAKA